MVEEIQSLTEDNAKLGFITVLGSVSTGLVGGLLILNRLGHPMEFLCTAPVHTNPAQEVLYGASLQPYLYGRHIAASLVRKAKNSCFAFMTDQIPVLSLQESLKIPVLMVFGEKNVHARGFSSFSEDEIRGFLPSLWHEWEVDSLAKDRVAIINTIWNDSSALATIKTGLRYFLGNVDFSEPFERIGLAIRESQRG